MNSEQFKELKRKQQLILDHECDPEYNNYSGLSDEDDPQDWCPEHW